MIRVRRPGPRLIAALVALVIVLAAAFMWLRSSSLVAVQRVRIAGANGADAVQIRSALVAAARDMTTLDVKMSQLRMAVAPYPVVKRLDVSTQFPHGMRIEVIEQVPVAIVIAGGRRIAVSGDGTLLRDVVPTSSLPAISLQVPPVGSRLTGFALSEVRLLAFAPYQLLPRIGQVTDGGSHGLVAELRNGPSIYFGDSSWLSAKWSAATEVLANSGSAGAVYVDVTVPGRPAAGVGPAGGGPAGGSSAAAAGAAGADSASSSDGTAAASSGGSAGG